MNTVTKSYDVFCPKPGWSEQKPEDWWSAFVVGIKELAAKIDKSFIKGIAVAGAGDNAAAAIGTATVGEGRCNISLGTSGTVFISSDKFGVDTNNALHSFCHADGGYHLMGCMLSAASKSFGSSKRKNPVEG